MAWAKELCENFPAADAVFETASKALGFDIKDMIFNGDSETLMITENTQPANPDHVRGRASGC